MSICNVPRQAFLAEKPPLVFDEPYTLIVKPKQLGSTYGWQGSRPNQLVNVEVGGQQIVSRVMTACVVKLSGKAERGLPLDTFVANAEAMDVSDMAKVAEAREFRTGSLGWHAHQKKKVSVLGEEICISLTFNATLRRSKRSMGDAHSAESDEECDVECPAFASQQLEDEGNVGQRDRQGDESAPANLGSRKRQRISSYIPSLAHRFIQGIFFCGNAIRRDVCPIRKDVRPGSNDVNDFTALFFPGPESLAKFVEVLREATETIDVAVYLLTEDRLADVLLCKHHSGVRVRVITDDDMSDKYETSDVGKLVKAGVPVRMDSSKFHMHHKFVVIDRRISISGSFNWTTPSAEGLNLENVVVSRRFDVVASFAARFEHLWKAFGPDGACASGPFSIEGALEGDCQVLFYPDEDDVNFNNFVKTLQSARTSFDVAVFMLTVKEALDAIKDAHARGVKVRVITDNSCALVHGGEHVADLRAVGVAVRHDKSHYHMHHKFAVIDQEIVITGSFNWTRQAEDGNHEDCMMLHGQRDLATAYTAEFNRLWADFA